MNNEKIEIDVELTEKMIEEYFSKMDFLKQKKLIICLLLIIILIIMSIIYKSENFAMFYIGFFLAYFFILISQQARAKKVSKELIKIIPNKNTYIITEKSIKIICNEDEEIRTKIIYNNINSICESKNLIIIIFNLNTRYILIPKDSLNQDQMDKLKEILLANVTADKIKLKIDELFIEL